MAAAGGNELLTSFPAERFRSNLGRPWDSAQGSGSAMHVHRGKPAMHSDRRDLL